MSGASITEATPHALLLSSRNALGYDAVTSDAPSRESVRAAFVVPVITASGNGAFFGLTPDATVIENCRGIRWRLSPSWFPHSL